MAFVVTPVLTSVLRGRGIEDLANARSSHQGSVPRGGGLAVFIAIAVGVVVAEPDGWGAPVVAAVLAAIAIAVVGGVDDLRGDLSPLARLIAVLVIGLAASLVIGDLDRPLDLGLAVVAAVWMAAVTNAFNFMDGINGITALHSVVVGASLAWVAHHAGVTPVAAVACALAAGAVGFLPWNLQGRIFLGDIGSYGIGALIAGMIIVLLGSGVAVEAPVGCLLPYLADTGLTIVRRAAARESLLEAHRDHAYQRWSDRFGAHAPAALMVAALAATCSVMAIYGADRSGVIRLALAGGSALLAIGYAVSPDLAGRAEGAD